MIDIIKRFPEAVEVSITEIEPKDDLLVVENVDGVDQGFFFVTVRDVYPHQIFSTGDLQYLEREYLFYRLPKALPTTEGSIILNPRLAPGVASIRSLISATLAKGRWRVVSSNGFQYHFHPSEIISYEKVLYDPGA